jgi:phosphatidylserine decarboxylase
MRETRHHGVIFNLLNHRFNMSLRELFDDELYKMGSAVVLYLNPFDQAFFQNIVHWEIRKAIERGHERA